MFSSQRVKRTSYWEFRGGRWCYWPGFVRTVDFGQALDKPTSNKQDLFPVEDLVNPGAVLQGLSKICARPRDSLPRPKRRTKEVMPTSFIPEAPSGRGSLLVHWAQLPGPLLVPSWRQPQDKVVWITLLEATSLMWLLKVNSGHLGSFISEIETSRRTCLEDDEIRKGHIWLPICCLIVLLPFFLE